MEVLTPNHACKRWIDAPSRWITLAACAGCLGIALLGMGFQAPVARASACSSQVEYTGPANGSWEPKANWSGDTTPTAAQTVCIPEGKGSIEVPASFKATAKTLVAQSAVKIASGGTLAIAETTGFGGVTSTIAGLDLESGGHLTTAGGWIFLTGTNLIEGEISRTNPVEVLLRLVSGTLSGNGTIAVQFNNQGGTVEPGGAGVIGTLHLTMLSSQSAGGTLVLDIQSETSFDKLAMGSNFGPSGTLDVNLLGGYAPPVGTQFRFLSGGGGTIGEFETITPGFEELPEPNEDTIRVSPRKPTVVTEPASAITSTSAILNGSVNPNTEQVTICDFEFGTDGPPYGGSSTCPTPPGKGPSPVAETEALTNLTPGTTYHFRIVAVNHEGGESKGIDRSFTTLPASKGEEEPSKEIPVEKAPVEEKPPSGGGSTTTTTTTPGTSTTTPTIGPSALPGGIPAPVATAPKAVEELLLGCSSGQLVLNDAYIHGGRVLLIGSATKSLAGKKVEILFNERKPVATATVGANGQFATTAPLPPAKIREALSTRYTAEVGKVRSLHLKLTRRLLLEPPTASGTTVTLSGQVTPPLTKPAAPVVVEQQLECGKTTVVKTFTPPANGHFNTTLTVPANARAGIFRLTSKVAANTHATKHGFTTFSLPLPVALGWRLPRRHPREGQAARGQPRRSKWRKDPGGTGPQAARDLRPRGRREPAACDPAGGEPPLA